MSIISFPMTSPFPAARPAARRRAALLLLGAQQPRQLETLAPLEELLLRLGLLSQSPQADEAARRLVVELVAALVGRQLLAVQAVLALAPDHRGLALEQLHPHLAADEAL